jgi:hypothetical protein
MLLPDPCPVRSLTLAVRPTQATRALSCPLADTRGSAYSHLQVLELTGFSKDNARTSLRGHETGLRQGFGRQGGRGNLIRTIEIASSLRFSQ